MSGTFALIQNAVELGIVGFSVDINTLEAHALILALHNHVDKMSTQGWTPVWVSREWKAALCSAGSSHHRQARGGDL
jgi:hypothetical protein